MKVVTLVDQSYAIGLWWIVGPDGAEKRRKMLQHAQERSMEFNKRGETAYNIAALRSRQFGLGAYADSDMGKKKRIYSLAAALTAAWEKGVFIGVFRLDDDLWWVCVIDNGLVIGLDGDVYFSTEAEARERANSARQVVDGEEKVFPTVLDSHNYLASVLKPETPLVELFPRRSYRGPLLAASALLAIVSSIWAYGYFQERELELQLRLTQAAKDTYRLELQQHPERFFTMQWVTAPGVPLAGQQCVDVMLQQHLVIDGWSVGELQCFPDQHLIVYREHTKGAAFTQLPQDVRLISAQKTQQILPLPQLSERSSGTYKDLPTRDEATAYLYQFTQNSNANLSLNWHPPEQVAKEDLMLTAPWQEGQFELSVLPYNGILTLDVFKALDFPGVVLSSLSYSDYSWKVQGVSYARSK